MRMRTKKIIKAGIAFLSIFIMIPGIIVKADYRYDEFEQTIPAQAVYTAATNYNGAQLDIGNFNSPTDFYVYNDTDIYILDAGNNRIVQLNQEFEVIHVFDALGYESESLDISGAKGIYVSDEQMIYVADTMNARIIMINPAGQVENIIYRPESVLLTDDIAFLPKNVVTDAVGTLYVISENSTQGAYMISATGEFLGFYGRNKVDVTADVLFQAMLRKFVSEEQRARMGNFIPIEFSNFDVDKEGFIYTVTSHSETPKSSEMIRKLNPLGENILPNPYRTWGDEPEGDIYRTYYVDIAVDEQGFIYALDSYYGRIYMYDNTGFQISIMGGRGTQLGSYQNAAAIDTMQDKLLVLDSKKNNITVYHQTDFGKLLINGLILYNQGKLEESLAYFEDVVKKDANFNYVYYAMAETYYDMEDYDKASHHAELSGVSQEVFSKAKKMVRNDWIRSHFTLVVAGIIMAALLIMAFGRIKQARAKEKRLLELRRLRNE